MTPKKLYRLIVGLVLAGFFVWLILRQINLEELRQTFAAATSLWIIAGLTAFLVGYACRIERWRQMLIGDNPQLKWSDCAGPLLASFAVNNVLPFRAGDVMRTFAFNNRLGASSGTVVATLFVERLLDLLMVLLLLGVALTSFGMEVSRFVEFGSVVLIVGALAIMLVLLFPRLFAPIMVAAGKFAIKLAPSFGQKLLNEINKSLATLQHLAQGGAILKLLAWSLLAWLAEGCVFWFAAFALPSINNPIAAWLALPVGTLATLIPSTPGYIGTFDYFTVRAMTELGNDQVAATAYAFLVHALLLLPPTLIGGLYLLLHPTTLKNRSEAAQK